ncbi:MAG: T9SS type A sorting domain-containing protein [Muribaculaceae bacterium]|nr:T9SS type A sorting domain-containing protein [Bacteroidales bacterium]MDY6186068.1 T9SS type A sorting domain-containing protein [Muribaculaceae bacterium]
MLDITYLDFIAYGHGRQETSANRLSKSLQAGGHSTTSRSIGPRHARPNAATTAIVGTSGISDATGYSLSAYPVPATTEVTVTSPEAIRDIRVFSSTGAEVARVAGEDSYTQSVDVSTLASGVYMIVINEQTPIRIVKK